MIKQKSAESAEILATRDPNATTNTTKSNLVQINIRSDQTLYEFMKQITPNMYQIKRNV